MKTLKKLVNMILLMEINYFLVVFGNMNGYPFPAHCKNVKAVENITDHQEKEEHNWNSSSY
jgi:hypothetical protein